jgi:hypothetical protein
VSSRRIYADQHSVGGIRDPFLYSHTLAAPKPDANGSSNQPRAHDSPFRPRAHVSSFRPRAHVSPFHRCVIDTFKSSQSETSHESPNSCDPDDRPILLS